MVLELESVVPVDAFNVVGEGKPHAARTNERTVHELNLESKCTVAQRRRYEPQLGTFFRIQLEHQVRLAAWSFVFIPATHQTLVGWIVIERALPEDIDNDDGKHLGSIK